MKVDDESPARWTFNKMASDYAWLDVNSFNGTNVESLKTGAHTIEVSADPGTEIDALALLWVRNDNPSVLELVENVDGKEPLSRIDGRSIASLSITVRLYQSAKRPFEFDITPLGSIEPGKVARNGR